MLRVMSIGFGVRLVVIGTIALSAGCSAGEKSPTSTITPPKVVASLAVSPSQVTLNAVGSVQLLTAVARNASGAVIADAPVTWQSANDAIATVSSSGSVTAVAGGVVTISATSGSVTGSAQVTVTAPPSALRWTIERQSLGYVTFKKVWQASTGEIFAVGEGGTIARGIGNVWSQIAPGVTPYSYNDVWGSSAHDVVVVSENGQILRWDGNKWTTQWSDPTTPLYGVWGIASDNIFAVGTAGCVLHWNGATWQRSSTGVDESLMAVWASSANNVIAVSRFGTAMHWDGTAWRNVPTGVGGLSSVWGFSPTDVYAVGGYDALHWDGQAWSRIDVGVSWQMNRVTGTPDGELFIAGEAGVVHRRGGAWQALDFAGLRGPLFGVWANSSADVVAVGHWGVAYRWDSAGWSVLLDPKPISDVLSLGAGDTYVLSGGVLYRWSGSRLTPVNANGRLAYSVWGTSTSSLWLAAQSNVMMWWDGTAWHETTFNLNYYPIQVFGTSAKDIVAVTRVSTLHWDGGAWQTRLMPPGSMFGIPRLWGTASDTVFFAVGPRGVILRQSAAAWQATTSGTTVDLHGVWGTSSRNVYAVGDNGVILHWDGSTWQRDNSGTTTNLLDVWGTAANDIYVVGQNGLILRNDGTGWTSLPSGTTEHLFRIHGTSASAVFAVGMNGVMLRGAR